MELNRSDSSFFVIPASLLVLGMALIDVAVAQERITPTSKTRGGRVLATPWSKASKGTQRLKFPSWQIPGDLQRWNRVDRKEVHTTLMNCLGDLPKRPNPGNVKVLSREDKGDYWLERIEFDNGLDALVPGTVLIPKNGNGRRPTIIGLHGHGGSAETICTDTKNSQCVGPMLAKRGYVVAAIDTYFCGRRSHKSQDARYRGASESDLFKIHLWHGRSLWGLMQRDQQCLIDYLQIRKDVDPERIGVTGMSMGGTGSWWLAAIDDRIKAVVGVAGFTRYEQLIAHNNQRLHGIYYYVPGILKHFDTEAIYSLIAPRPMLMLSGDQDAGLPIDGIEILERKVSRVYNLYDKTNLFHSVVYRNTGHEYLPEMQNRMADWFDQHLGSR